MPFPDLPHPPIPLPDFVPWDVPIAQRAGWWIELYCGTCQSTRLLPLRLMASERGWKLTLRQIAPRLKCGRCKSAPTRMFLTDDASGSHGRAGAVAKKLDMLA